MLDVTSDPIVKISISLRRSQIDGLQAVANAAGHRKRSRVAQEMLEKQFRARYGAAWRKYLASILATEDEEEEDAA